MPYEDDGDIAKYPTWLIWLINLALLAVVLSVVVYRKLESMGQKIARRM